jgi:phosphomannomutase
MVVDAANGTGGIAFNTVYRDVSVEVVRMYFEPDGTFPNHGGDPMKEENRRELQERVVQEGADLGCAFDPDADRFFAIDARGEFVPSDFITAILGKYIIEKNSNSGTIIYDTRSSWAVRDLVRGAGGETVEMRVGHPFIKAKMRETGAHFAGEVSGHYYYNKFYCCDSGVLPSLLLLEMLGTYGKSLREVVAPLRRKYFLSGEINLKVRDADASMDIIKDTFRNNLKHPQVDGLGLEGENWHANIRKSNTEPLLRLNVEGLAKKKMEEKRDLIKGLIESLN